jgi:2-C-methyl-D-erythritol 2,4-cyclodiphosphate synthase
MDIRVGFGYDVHQLAQNYEFWLGGVRIDHSVGAVGHSDADVLLHVICDAALGAANMRDIGFHFPDTDPDLKGVDSKVLLAKTIEIIGSRGWRVGNIDSTICLQKPKLAPHIPSMQECIAGIVGIDNDAVSIKATTTEKLGFVGREEGISAYAVILLQKD